MNLWAWVPLFLNLQSSLSKEKPEGKEDLSLQATPKRCLGNRLKVKGGRPGATLPLRGSCSSGPNIPFPLWPLPFPLLIGGRSGK